MQEFLMIAAAHFLATLSPGQDFVLLVRTSLRQGRRMGLICAAGIAAANALWIGLILAGLEGLRDIAPLMLALRLVGGAFLLWLGWRFLQSRPAVAPPDDTSSLPADRPEKAASFWTGLLSGLSNPKNGLFYATLFSFGLSGETAVSLRLLYGVWMVGVVLVWDGIVALGFGDIRAQRWLGRWQHRIEQGAGAVLLAMGAGILLKF